MHLDLFLRGKIEFVSLWESHLQSQYFKFRRTNIKTGEESVIAVQLGLRRGVFGSYELVFPKEALSDVLAILGINENTSYKHLSASKYKHFVMRTLFGDKQIPRKALQESKKIQETRNTLLIDNSERVVSNALIPGIAVHPIGIKYDKFGTIDGVYKHELL